MGGETPNRATEAELLEKSGLHVGEERLAGEMIARFQGWEAEGRQEPGNVAGGEGGRRGGDGGGIWGRKRAIRSRRRARS